MASPPDIFAGPDGQPLVPIEEKHGDDCTCKPLGHVHVDLVAASRACPGDRNPHRGGTITAQLEEHEPPWYPGLGIVITWPATTRNDMALKTWPMQMHDHATGEPLLAVTGLRMVLGGEQWDTPVIRADIRTCVDSDGQPLIGAPANVVPDPDDPERFYSKVFRCYVTEMRIRETDAEKDAREQWEKLQRNGVQAGYMLKPESGATLTFTVPDDWAPAQHEDLAEHLAAWFPDNQVLVHPRSIELDEPTRESVNRGEHTIDEYRAHHGHGNDTPDTPAEEHHRHLFARDMSSLCRCGMTAEQYQRLLADETAGRPHASETTKPTDQYGRTIEESRP